MTENEVNKGVEKWLIERGYKYKGVNKRKPTAPQSNSNQFKELKTNQFHSKSATEPSISKQRGYGQVPVPLPDGSRSILIDHQGFSDKTKELVWIEAKGSENNLSELLEGFVRLCVAVYWGGGSGYLAVPNAEYEKLLEQREFLEAVAHSVNGKGLMGLLDIEKQQQLML